VHYPRALHEVEALRDRVVFRDAPERAAAAARRVLSLPIYPELPAEHQDHVIRSLRSFAPS
jgi:dTDP-4-amino-4,6-dideoxygalactose transaminase